LSTRTASASRRKFLAFVAAALAGPLAGAEEPSFDGIRYRTIEPGSADSAGEVARRMLGHLVEGDLASAARLSNAPEQRERVLRAYLASVGDAEFRRVYAQYAAVPIAAEVAIGERHLLIWDLPGSAGGQFFIGRAGAFLLDDVPSAERRTLQRLLRAYRDGKFRPSAGTG
jgi:hypothetical protein